MGWLLGKKKLSPKVPFPSEQEGTLKFPTSGSFERIIEPEQVKEAAGLEEPKPVFNLFKKNTVPQPEHAAPAIGDGPHYLKLEVYKAILGELEQVKTETIHLQNVHSHLLTSEYNEENKLVKLRRAVRGIHDKLLQVDKILFKG